MCHPHLTLYSFFSLAQITGAQEQCQQPPCPQSKYLWSSAPPAGPIAQIKARLGLSCDTSVKIQMCWNIKVLDWRTLSSVSICEHKEEAGFTDLLLCGREKQTQKTVEIFSFTLYWPMGAATIWTRPKIFLKKGGLTKKETFTNTTSYLYYIKLPRTVWDLLCRHFYKHFL